jgi:glycogen operon protein
VRDAAEGPRPAWRPAPAAAAPERVREGAPYPLGATWDGAGVNVAAFSANATRVDLCLFDAEGRREIRRLPLPEHTHQVWHGYFPDLRPGQLYGLRAHGPYAPEAGHRFNAHKLLVDPYARALTGEVRWHDSLFGYRIGHPRADLSFDRRDSARAMPKCRIVDPAFSWGADAAPRRPWAGTVIYEAHVKGMTALRTDAPERLRGTFAGLAEPGVIDHLARLGVTALELMPVHAFVDDRHLLERGLRNHWGYNTLAFFAPAPRYAAGADALDEFRLMVRRLHDAGIEAILDVVYNHTAEGNHLGPTLSFRGLDNASYYVAGDDPRYCFDTTGCGNLLNLRHPAVLKMVMDSLRFWVEECHVDGFRFDLATALTRDRGRVDMASPFLEAIGQDPVLSRVKLIAESWDVGPDGYQVGGFPPGWAEWNGPFRDEVRGFWRGDAGALPGLARRLAGSAETFGRAGRRPWASVNFVTAHDGFTLADLYAYDAKRNEANGEGNRDGHDDNRSWNCGAEGPTDDPEVRALRLRLRRAAMATLLLSHGAPMILMGDELGRSQGGNNNAYCQDGPISWMDWDAVGPDEAAFRDYVAGLVALRAEVAPFRPARFAVAAEPRPPGAVQAVWLRPDGIAMAEADWADPQARAVALRLRDAEGAAALLLVNGAADTMDFRLPDPPEGRTWRLRLDSATGVVPARDRAPAVDGARSVAGRSIAALVAG